MAGPPRWETFMPRRRLAATALLLALVLFAASPGAVLALRGSEQVSAATQVEPLGERLVGSALAWSRGALAWLQALFAAEHGFIVPVAPPPSGP